ncbi:MAG: DUF4382 domain-containing protein [Phormidesmis sp.]
MNLRRFWTVLPITFAVMGCSQSSVVESGQSGATAETFGRLVVTANGEDFVRQGFVTKDGWQVDFEHVYVTLADIEVYQTEPSFDPEKQSQPTAQQTISVPDPVTVDLAEGDEKADPIVVAEIGDAPSGRYNALSWRMVSPDAGPAAGYPIVLMGTATKDGASGEESIDFRLQLSEQLAFVCGDFIGDARKGILSEGQSADVEATFHFDHLFGDGDAPADDEINQGALGFEPIAKLAQDGEAVLSSDELQQNLNKADSEKLLTLLPSLGHVGEGHCEETLLN